MKNENIKAVGLDAWGTLIQYGPTTQSRRRYAMEPLIRTLSEQGIDIAVDDFYQKYREFKNATEKASEESGRHIGPFDRHLGILKSFGLSVDELDINYLKNISEEATRRAQSSYPELIEPNISDSFAQLQERGIRLGVISNLGVITADYMRQAFDRLGIRRYFSHEFYSDETGICKPNPQIFTQFATETECDPENMLFIGDNKSADFDGPRALGMHAIHLTNNDPAAEFTAPNVSMALRMAGLIQ